MMMKLPKPYLGRAIIEAIEENVKDYLAERRGLDKDSELKKLGFTVVEAEAIQDSQQRAMEGKAYRLKEDSKVPLKKGKILDIAPDWGFIIQKKFEGYDLGYIPGIGDIVWFVPNETYALDPERKYHLLNDCDIVAYERG